MSIAPDTVAGPLAQAPPDRPTRQLEDLLNQVTAILFADRVMDMQEKRLFRGFMEQVALRAQEAGGIGLGRPSTPGAPGELPTSPQQMNAETEDFGTSGEPREQEF